MNKRSLEVHWHASPATEDFRRFSLSHPSMRRGGVYIIRCGDRALRVGQARFIASRLRAHQRDIDVVGSTSGPLTVVWAWIPKAERDGVEAFLGACLRPEVGDRFPSVPKIFVNLPSGLRAHRRGENEEIVGPTDVVETTRGGGVALSYPSSFEKVETDMDQEQSALASAPANEEHSLQSADELREIISDIRHCITRITKMMTIGMTSVLCVRPWRAFASNRKFIPNALRGRS